MTCLPPGGIWVYLPLPPPHTVWALLSLSLGVRGVSHLLLLFLQPRKVTLLPESCLIASVFPYWREGARGEKGGCLFPFLALGHLFHITASLPLTGKLQGSVLSEDWQENFVSPLPSSLTVPEFFCAQGTSSVWNSGLWIPAFDF